MSKLMMIILAIVMTGGIAFAAVTTGTFGDQNSNKIYRMQVDTDGVIYAPQDTNIGLGTAIPQGRIDVGGFTKTNVLATDSVGIKGDLEVDGKIYTDGSIYGDGMSAIGSAATAVYVCFNNSGKFFYRKAACP